MSSIKKIFGEFSELVKSSIANFDACLMDGASEEEIKTLQDKVRKKLPKDFVELYRIHNGEVAGKSLCLMAGLRFLPIKKVISEYDSYIEFNGVFDSFGIEAISQKPSRKNIWIPFASDEDECVFAIDLSPTQDHGTVGQVIALEHGLKGNASYLMADSLSEFLEKLIVWWKNGSIVPVNNDGELSISEKRGHFFNSISEYSLKTIMDVPCPDKNIDLKDEFWIDYFGKKSISTTELSKMKELEFWITEQDISCEPFAYFGYPKVIYFFDCKVRDFHFLGQNKNVETLYLCRNTIEGGDLSILKGCTNLQEIMLNGLKDLGGIESLLSLPKLNKLHYVGDITENIRSLLVSLPHLTSLSLHCLTRNSSNLSFLSTLKNLKELVVEYKDDTRLENIDFLLALNNLRVLNINTYATDEKSLASVLQLKKLKEFNYPVRDLELYRNNTKLSSLGIWGRESIDVSVLAETKCTQVYLFGTESFRKTKPTYQDLKRELLHTGKIKTLQSIKLLTDND